MLKVAFLYLSPTFGINPVLGFLTGLLVKLLLRQDCTSLLISHI